MREVAARGDIRRDLDSCKDDDVNLFIYVQERGFCGVHILLLALRYTSDGDLSRAKTNDGPKRRDI
jgi:hypothetical protein